MLTKDSLKIATTVAVGFGLAFLILGTSPSFQACIYEHQNHGGGTALKENVSSLHIFYIAGRVCTGEWLHRHGEKLIALFTVILGIATWLLWRATQALVKGAEATAKRQLRAYVLLESAKIKHVAVGEKPKATVKIKNFGQTPAYQLTHWAAMEYATFPRTEDPDMSDPEGMPIAHIGQGGRLAKEVPLDNGSELSGEQFEAINSGKAALYLIGRAAYVDAFGDVQSTEYIVFVGGPLGLGPDMAGYHKGHKAS
jgi:hypothetical protein